MLRAQWLALSTYTHWVRILSNCTFKKYFIYLKPIFFYLWVESLFNCLYNISACSSNKYFELNMSNWTSLLPLQSAAARLTTFQQLYKGSVAPACQAHAHLTAFALAISSAWDTCPLSIWKVNCFTFFNFAQTSPQNTPNFYLFALLFLYLPKHLSLKYQIREFFITPVVYIPMLEWKPHKGKRSLSFVHRYIQGSCTLPITKWVLKQIFI